VSRDLGLRGKELLVELTAILPCSIQPSGPAFEMLGVKILRVVKSLTFNDL